MWGEHLACRLVAHRKLEAYATKPEPTMKAKLATLLLTLLSANLVVTARAQTVYEEGYGGYPPPRAARYYSQTVAGDAVSQESCGCGSCCRTRPLHNAIASIDAAIGRMLSASACCAPKGGGKSCGSCQKCGPPKCGPKCGGGQLLKTLFACNAGGPSKSKGGCGKSVQKSSCDCGLEDVVPDSQINSVPASPDQLPAPDPFEDDEAEATGLPPLRPISRPRTQLPFSTTARPTGVWRRPPLLATVQPAAKSVVGTGVSRTSHTEPIVKPASKPSRTTYLPSEALQLLTEDEPQPAPTRSHSPTQQQRHHNSLR